LKNIRVEFLIHPSPASPAANSGWSDLALKTLTEINVINLLRPEPADSEVILANPVQYRTIPFDVNASAFPDFASPVFQPMNSNPELNPLLVNHFNIASESNGVAVAVEDESCYTGERSFQLQTSFSHYGFL